MKFKAKSVQISKLRKNTVIDWQGKPHRVRSVTFADNGAVSLSLSWATDPDFENLSFKASAYDAYAFTTRALAPTLRVDRLIPVKS